MARTPKYRRHSERDLGFVEFDGRRIYFPGKYKSPESLTAYRNFLNQHVHIFAERLVPSARMTVAELTKLFLAHAERTYPVGTRSEFANFKATIKLLLAIDAATHAIDYGPVRLKALQAFLAQSKKSRGYLNSTVGRVRRIFKWAAGEELIPASIYHALVVVPGVRKGRSVAKEPSPRQPVGWDSVDAILPELSDTVRAMVEVQWYTGARSQSICLARPEQFDRSKTPWVWMPRHKTENTHAVTLFVGPEARNRLGPLIDAAREGAYLFRPLNLNGKRSKGYRSFYDSVSYLRAVKRAIDRTNDKLSELGQPPIPHWTPHQIRHARATLVRAEHGLEAAQAALGHARVDAAQIYAKRLDDLARMVAEKMG